MSAKISISFGNVPYTLPVEMSTEFFLGCSDAFLEMGLFKFHQLVDLVEVVRIYPNQGLMTEGQIVVEVIVASCDQKRSETFLVKNASQTEIRALVKSGVVRIAKDLAEDIAKHFYECAGEVSSRLGC